jgi:hypothetical protein
VPGDGGVHIAGMSVRPKLLYGMRKDLLVGLNAKITLVNLTLKAYLSTVTHVLYNFQIRIYINKTVLPKNLRLCDVEQQFTSSC